MTILEDLKAGRLVVVPREADGWIVTNANGDKFRCWIDGWSNWTDDRDQATRYARRRDAEAVHAEDDDAWRVVPFTASPDHTTALLSLVEGMERANQFMKAAYESLAATADSNFSKWGAAEARALAAEAKVEALREALAPFARAAGFYALQNAPDDAQVVVEVMPTLSGALEVGDFRRARALTQEQNNG